MSLQQHFATPAINKIYAQPSIGLPSNFFGKAKNSSCHTADADSSGSDCQCSICTNNDKSDDHLCPLKQKMWQPK